MDDIDYYIGQGMKYFDTPEFIYYDSSDAQCDDFSFNYTLSYDYNNGTISTTLPEWL
jgi:hypothetical protein